MNPYLFHAQTEDGLHRDGDYLEITLKTEPLAFDRVYIRHEPDNEEYLIEMHEIGSHGRLTLWSARIPLNKDRELTHYLFKVLISGTQYWLDARGVQLRMPGKEYHFKYNAVNQPPQWVSGQVFYQIFPERFCNGNPEITPKAEEIKVGTRSYNRVVKEWGEETGEYNTTAASEFYGGDLAGIASKLDYLQNLGVTALYLNPIFESYSNHKYDTNDYFNVDPGFGTNEEFAALSSAIHQRDMRVVLDAVVNHTSVSHNWFDINDNFGNGAYHHKDSPYRDYYFFDDESNDYVGWKNIGSLPVLNFNNRKLRDQIYTGDDAVLRHWLREPYNIDGWRFDVIHMLGEGEGARNNAHYVQEFRRVTKEENSEAYVLGEHFFEASQWLQGDQEDGAMNYYGFAHPVRALLANQDITYDPIALSIPQFVEWLIESKAKVPFLNQISQLNQLDSHDTRRFLTLVGGDENRMKLALFLLFTYVGVPCLYYGTEVGLEGGDDPDCRRSFPWERIDFSSWLPFCKMLINFRKTSPELQRGSFVLLDYSEEFILFARQLGDRTSVIAVSLTASGEVIAPVWKLGIENQQGHLIEEDGTNYNSLNGELSIELNPYEAKIICFTS